VNKQEAALLEDLSFDDASDMAAVTAVPGVRRYLAEDDEGQDIDLGLRALAEYPEALSRLFRNQLQ
jgi:hypothetical protein